MPIGIGYPVNGQEFGPGFSISFTTTRIGPEPTGTEWRVFIMERSPLEEVCMQWTIPWTGTQVIGQYMTNPGPVQFVAPLKQWTTGHPSRLLINLVSPQGLVVDTGQVDVVLNMDTGVQYQLSRQQQTGASGFTEDDRNVLQGVNNAVYRDFGDGVPIPLNLILNMPPLESQRRYWLGDRGGEGDLNPADVLPGFLPHAIEVEIVSHPVGIGVNEGAPDALELDYVQLEHNVRLMDQHFVITDRISENAGRVLWQGQPWNPSSIHYYVLPGVVARFWWVGLWLTGPLPQPPLA